MTEKVNWEIFDIDPWDDSQDVSRSQILHEYSKYDGSPEDFADELAKRFEWSGMMCETVVARIKAGTANEN